MRIFDLAVSLPLLIISFVFLAFILYIWLKNTKLKIYIPVILSLYGFVFCVLQIYVLSKGFSGIPYVLISWLFLILLTLSLLYVVWSMFKLRHS
ncbi:hypothetical protein LYSBPC_24250 [Lysinibacillus piscis]|uniref:Uncharacterized protein n=1 Tax=Lysinibacillus piscis TaxID=2518931 RepID=A0ABQ5NME2_9BACI|nr:hypothetical protein LYSBPC_24250 [Lysinibacillus sp. KH24]